MFTFRSARVFALVAVFAGFAFSQQDWQQQRRDEANAALAQTNGTLKVIGLRAPVEVLRDNWGVAHIFAKNQHDLFFAQGFVAAQDRLFQMELWKRIGQGRLAELLGQAFLERDLNARLLQYRGDMQAEYASYGPDTREILAAFTDGINSFIATSKAAGKLPIEFKYAMFEPEPWKPEDCLMRMAGFPMTGNARAELSNAQLMTKFGAENAAKWLDLSPKTTLDPVPGVDYSGLSESFLRNLVGSDTRINFAPGAQVPPSESALPPCHDLSCFVTREALASVDANQAALISSDNESSPLSLEESNDWTISGKLTATGKPILANDPHRAINVPSLRYIVHLVAPAADGKPAWNVTGAGEPGLPGVAVGHNQSIAWGFTIFPIDQQDLYLEELNPQNPLEYRTEHGWEKMRVEQAQFRVLQSLTNGAMTPANPLVTRELKFTRHGPVLWADGKRALALRWVGAEPGTAGYLASLSVDRAQDWKQFLGAMERWKVPPENIVYADVNGNIGEQSAGLAPIRSWSGLLPTSGDGKHEWQGWVPLDQLPRKFNPPEGYYATANNKVINDDYKYRIGYSWSTPYRVDRVNQLLHGEAMVGHKMTLKDMGDIQSDVTSLAAKPLLAVLHDAAKQNPKAAETPEAKLLLDFNGTITRDAPAAALYEAWVRALRARVGGKLVASMLSKSATPSDQTIADRLPMSTMIELLQHPTKEVFGENPEDARASVMFDAIGDARLTMMKQFPASHSTSQGNMLTLDTSQWNWGKLHGIEFRHSLGPGALPDLDIAPTPRPGDGTTVNATGFGTNWRQTAGASYRELFDLSDWDKSLAVNTPGQSGQPESPHYKDLLPLWDKGEYFPLRYSREAIEKVTRDRLVLTP